MNKMVEWKKICQISSNVFAGGTPNTKHKEYYDGEIPWIRSGEIDFNVITSAQRNITQAGLTNSSAKLIRKGSVVMAMTGATVAKTAIVDFETAANQSVCAIETNESIANYRFIYYSLANNYFKIKSSAQGALTSLNLAMIKQIKLPIPSLSEQKRIVDILDTFTASIENLNQQIAERRKQFEHYRDTLLDFEGRKDVEWKTIGDLFVFKNGLNKGKEYFGKGYPIVNFTDVFNNPSIKEETLKGKVDVNAKEISNYQVHRGDVFFTRTSETQSEIGMASVMLDEISNCVFSGFVLRAHPITDKLLPEYCAYCFSDKRIRSYIVRYSSFTTRALTSGARLSKIPIPIPSIEEQEHIVNILDSFTTLISKLEEERDLHQKQYEYYREKLLTFE